MKDEISQVIEELEVVEDVLKKFGVTEDRFKLWFNLKECNCTKRKKWLNGLLSWKVSQPKD